MVHVSVTCFKHRLNTLEDKDNLNSSDLLAVKSHLIKTEALDVEFKEHHYAVINLVGNDEHILDEEQATMDNHEDKVAEIIERLQQLRPEAKAAFSIAHFMDLSHHLRRRLNNVERSLRLVKGKFNPLTPSSDLDSCLLLQLIRGAGRQYKVRALRCNQGYSVL